MGNPEKYYNILRNDVYTASIKNTYHIFLIDFLLQQFWSVGQMVLGLKIQRRYPKIQLKYESGDNLNHTRIILSGINAVSHPLFTDFKNVKNWLYSRKKLCLPFLTCTL